MSKFYALHKKGSVYIEGLDPTRAYISQKERTLFDSKEACEDACRDTFERGNFEIYEIRKVSQYTRI